MTRLEKTTHAVLIVVCVASLFLLLEAQLRLSQQAPVTQRGLVGQSLVLPGMDWHAASVNVVLAISSTCHFCNESMPFYQKLAAARQRLGLKSSLIVSSQDAIRTMQDHLAQEQLVVDRVVHSRNEALDITATPTILLVNSLGIVKRVFIGKLDHAHESEILSIIAEGKV